MLTSSSTLTVTSSRVTISTTIANPVPLGSPDPTRESPGAMKAPLSGDVIRTCGAMSLADKTSLTP
jgi:hypothetical protein